MKRYTLKEFDRQRNKILRLVENGEDVVITRHGRGVIRILKYESRDNFKKVETFEPKSPDFRDKSRDNSEKVLDNATLERSPLEKDWGVEVKPERRVYVDYDTGNEYRMTFNEVVGRVGVKQARSIWRRMGV